MNYRTAALLLCLVAHQVACTNSSAPTAKTPIKFNTAPQQIALAESDKKSETKSGEMTALKAKRLASNHLALKQISWGKATSMSEDESYFHLNYETPKRELRILGERTLLVEKATGVAKIRKRR